MYLSTCSAMVGCVSGELAKAEDLSVNEGAYVSGFGDMEDKSAAKEAGIQKGDVIVKLDQAIIKSSAALIEYIGRKRPGDKIAVVVNRKGTEKTFQVTLKNRDGKIGAIKREAKDLASSLGMELEDVDAKLLKRLELSSGVRVKSLGPGKLERYTEMRNGFIITHVDEKAVKTTKDINDIIKQKKAGDLITFSGVYEDFPREFNYAIRM
jgi:S1-C subfamily serine protease